MKTKSNLVQYSIFDVVDPEPVLVDEFSTTAPIRSSRYIEPDTDGITSEDFEHITIAKIKNIKIEITLAHGKSGKWYFGRSLQLYPEGSGYAAWPKFSDKFDTRYAAVSAAVINIIKWFHDRKPPKKTMETVLKSLARFTDGLTPDDNAVEETWNDQQRAAIAKRDGVSPDCPHLSIWNKTVCADDCDDCKSGCENPKALEG